MCPRVWGTGDVGPSEHDTRQGYYVWNEPSIVLPDVTVPGACLGESSIRFAAGLSEDQVRFACGRIDVRDVEAARVMKPFLFLPPLFLDCHLGGVRASERYRRPWSNRLKSGALIGHFDRLLVTDDSRIPK